MLTACVSSMQAGSAAEVLHKTASKIRNAGKVSCMFTLEGSKGSLKGTLNSEGSKFKLATPGSTTWFDGTRMWTSNPGTKEITLVTPTAEEIRESNPFSYLDSYEKDFNVFFSKRKDSGHYLVLLNPKRENTGLKAVEVAVNKKTFLPDRFIVRDSRDNVTTINVNSLSLKSNPGPGGYVCPVESMKDYEIIDLR